MNFEEARNCLLKGSKVRRHDWAHNEYIYLSECLMLFDEYDCKLPQNHDVFYDYEDDKWEIFYETIKPFKTQTLEWFRTEDKIPEPFSMLLYKIKNEPALRNAIVNCASSTFIKEVQFWAYLESVE